MSNTASRIDPANRLATSRPAPTSAARGGADINLAAFDLNLLVALDALLECRNVTHAGQRVGLSQPAMSRSLARLRGMLKDDLLVRSSAGLVPTPRAERLAEALPPILAQIRELLGSRSFLPGECRSTITLAMSDHQALVLLPRLLPRARERAPDLDVVVDSSLAGALKRLEQGEIDFAIGQIHDTPSGTYRRKLYSDRFACLLRQDHPALSQPWTPDSFAALRHAVIAPGSEDGFGKIYDSLARLQLSGRDPVLVPNAMTAPMMIAETDLVLTVPHRVATRLAAMLPLRVMEVPVELPPYEVCLIWHERRHRDAENRWMRAEIAAATLTAI
ncbi:LysR family transcriptional regulator [Roseomonas marmotae]|uniref:LysR family transcriptional regulator n=1 Tax=Roseomonas marmotae TaxID=2768161 RepID=A0ABS3K8A2_9PROT|nr:LysR family transcriptional regulator [Roseomonas marmotae]MBO1073689.1 LysR family transcriptional regulator [Roseomonas marmotae]QTI78669.1 LysR family transcriptional regulator [Roseomonas marmotae]